MLLVPLPVDPFNISSLVIFPRAEVADSGKGFRLLRARSKPTIATDETTSRSIVGVVLLQM